MLGYALGYSINQLDGLKTSHPNAPDSDCVSIVWRAAHARCVDTHTFVSALMTARQSPLVGAPQLASELAKGTDVLTVRMKMISYVCLLSRCWSGRKFSNGYIKWQ